MMKAMNVTASAVGNHEFDWGVSHMEKWQKDGGFDFLAANIYDTKTKSPVAWSKPYKIVEKSGLKVAFVGLAHLNTTTLTKRENVTGLEFKDPVKSAEEWIKYLIVKRNDTLRKIGKAYGVSWKRIAKLNNLKDPNMIFENQKLLIPA